MEVTFTISSGALSLRPRAYRPLGARHLPMLNFALLSPTVERYTPSMILHLEPDPVIEAYKRDIDLTLVRESLRLTVQQRVDRLLALQKAAEEFRKAGRKLRSTQKNS